MLSQALINVNYHVGTSVFNALSGLSDLDRWPHFRHAGIIREEKTKAGRKGRNDLMERSEDHIR